MNVNIVFVYSFSIVEGSENAKNYRLNALHMKGVERMSKKDIYQYFEFYPPDSVEWVDDSSCNNKTFNNILIIHKLFK